MKPFVSILIPAYNEERLLEAGINKLVEYMNSRIDLTYYEIIICDNGSTDNTRKISKKLGKKNNVKYAYTSVKGFGSAIKLGAKIASGELVLFLPADGEISFDFIDNCTRSFKKNSMCIGVRRLDKNRSASQFRYLLSLSFVLIVKTCFSLKLTEAGTVKAFETKWLKQFAPKCKKNDFAWQLEILYYALKQGLRVREIPIKIQSKRTSSESKVSLLHDTISLGLTCLKYGVLLRLHQIFKAF